MRLRLQIALHATLLAGLGFLTGGCEDAAKHGVQAHVPALNPANAAASQVPPTLRELPLRKLSHEWLTANRTDAQPEGRIVSFTGGSVGGVRP